MSGHSSLTEIVSALTETEPFQWSDDRAALIVEPNEDEPDTITVVLRIGCQVRVHPERLAEWIEAGGRQLERPPEPHVTQGT